jgi:hypothetical protein
VTGYFVAADHRALARECNARSVPIARLFGFHFQVVPRHDSRLPRLSRFVLNTFRVFSAVAASRDIANAVRDVFGIVLISGASVGTKSRKKLQSRGRDFP